MKLKTRIYFEDEEKKSFMGIGVLWLLEGIVESGSIRKAAERMNMSYTKAHNILKNLEDSLGRALLERHKGGNQRKGTELTPFGQKFLEKYGTLNRKIEEYGQAQFELFRKDMEMDES